MYQGIHTKRSCALAWIAACRSIVRTADEGYNVIIDVLDPINHNPTDNEVITLVDRFLRGQDEYPIVTVANTIFPQSLLIAHGPKDFYDVYHRDLQALSPSMRRWGRYFE